MHYLFNSIATYNPERESMENQPRIRVENANHDKVSYYIEKMLSESNRYCGCLRCRLDAVALALNTLPPHYYVEPGHNTKNEIGSPWVLIEMAVKEALERVRRNPHHSLSDYDEESVGIRAVG